MTMTTDLDVQGVTGSDKSQEDTSQNTKKQADGSTSSEIESVDVDDLDATQDDHSDDESSTEESQEDTSVETDEESDDSTSGKNTGKRQASDSDDDDLRTENEKLRGFVKKLASVPGIEKILDQLDGRESAPGKPEDDPEVVGLAKTLFGTDDEGNLKQGSIEAVSRLMSTVEARIEKRMSSKLAPHLKQTAELGYANKFNAGLSQAGVNPAQVGTERYKEFVARFVKQNPWIKSVDRDDPTQAGILIGRSYRKQLKALRASQEQRSRVNDARDSSLTEGGGRGTKAGILGNVVKIDPRSRDFNLRTIMKLTSQGKKIV